MEIDSLFNGIAIIIDDEVREENANIRKLIDQIQAKNMPYITFEGIPDPSEIKHFGGASFIILDWQLLDDESKEAIQTGVRMPSALREYNVAANIEFLNNLKESLFAPVFIFTNASKEEVVNALKEQNLYKDNEPNFIFVKNKSDLETEMSLFTEIEAWAKVTPSIYVLKVWEREYNNAKRLMFWDFYDRSSSWPCILWDCYTKDGVNESRALAECITRNLYSRMAPFSFDQNSLTCNQTEPLPEEMRKVLEGEHFVKSDQLFENDIATGDLFRIDSEIDGVLISQYWINIRAQCDLARHSNPELYCVKGKIREAITPENGQFTEKIANAIVAFVDGGRIIEFSFYNTKTVKWKEMKPFRVGRVLPPDITRIQQKYALFFHRQGLPRIPDQAIG